ncbi:hypothetical protein JCM3770_001267 [Rhodotorula araucariae]
MDWSTLEPQLTHPDNDKRVHGLAALSQLLESADQLADPDRLASVLRTSLKASNAHVSAAALACLPPLFPLLVPAGANPSHPSSSTAHSLRSALALLLPLDRLGDAKPATRQLARQGVVSAAITCLRLGVDAGAKAKDGGPWALVERGIHEYGFASKNAKAREQERAGTLGALHFLAAIRCPPPDSIVPLPPLRPFTPLLLPLLSDPDSSVRSLALHTTVAVFSHASVTPAAKADLKKAMAKLDVAKKVQEQILGAVLGGAVAASLERSPSEASLASTGGASEGSSSRGVAPRMNGGASVPDGPVRRLTRSQAASSHGPPSASVSATAPHTPSLLASLPAAAFPADPSAVHVSAAGDLAPVYVASEADLRSEFAQMHAAFDGKETEHNWMARDRHVATIRGMLLGGVADGELRAAFVQCVKEVQDGIMRTAASLRTTLAISALTLISELATSLPPSSLDIILDPFLTHVLSMAGQTKKIVATASQATASTLLTHANYHLRTVQAVSALLGEKTPQARHFGAAHVLALVAQHGAHPALEPSGGADELEQAVARALRDANAGVREHAREAWWEMRRQGSRADSSSSSGAGTGTGTGTGTGMAARADRVRDALDVTARKLLDKARPAEAADARDAAGSLSGAAPEDKPMSAAAHRTPAPVAAAVGAKKPSVKELMLAKRREALAAKERGTQAGETLCGDGDAAGFTTPTRAGQSGADESPASSETTQATPSRAGAAASVPAMPATPSRTPSERSPPPRHIVPGSIVDDALREQALQAEQAAERLLELAEDDAAPAPQSTPSAPRTSHPEAPFRTPAHNPVLRSLGLGAGAGGADASVFADSPDARDSALGAGTKGAWWLARAAASASRRPQAPPAAQAVEGVEDALAAIDALVARVVRGEVDVPALRALADMSRARPVRDDDEPVEGQGADAGAAAFWTTDGLLERVFEGLRTWLLRPGAAAEGGSTRDQALLLLRVLVENQFPCFAGAEGGVFDLLFRLREDPSRTSIAATEAISSAFTARLEPLYGVGALVPALDAYLATESPAASPAASYALGLRQMGAFFELLPREVLEDVLPRSAPLLKRALNDPTAPDLRRAALLALVSAHAALEGDAHRLDELVGCLEDDQKSLLAYYAAKRTGGL